MVLRILLGFTYFFNFKYLEPGGPLAQLLYLSSENRDFNFDSRLRPCLYFDSHLVKILSTMTLTTLKTNGLGIYLQYSISQKEAWQAEPLQHSCDAPVFLFWHHLSGHESATARANKLATTAKAMSFMVLCLFCSLMMRKSALPVVVKKSLRGRHSPISYWEVGWVTVQDSLSHDFIPFNFEWSPNSYKVSPGPFTVSDRGQVDFEFIRDYFLLRQDNT